MLNRIKKSIKYFIIVAGVIIILPTIIIPVLQIPEIQTLLVRRVTLHFSRKMNSDISIGRIEYKFFNKLSINDILIKDQNDDTLLYSKKAITGFKSIDFKKSTIRLGKVTLEEPIIYLITDSTGTMNLTWYLDMLKKPADSTKVSSGFFSFDQVAVTHGSFSLINKTVPAIKNGFDFKNLKINNLNLIFEDFQTGDDSTSFKIYDLSFYESGGFNLKRLSSSVTLANQNIILKDLYINCDSSIINIPELALKSLTAESFKHFVDEVNIEIILDKSVVSTSDLKHFIPSLAGINESVWISGKILGTVSELRGRNLELSYRDYTYLNCDFDFSGLPDINKAFIYIGVNSLKTNATDFENLNIPGKEKLVLPDFIYKLGSITFDGSFTGFTTDFVTYGSIITNEGNVRADISFRPEKSGRYQIKGLLTGSEIDLGNLTGKPDLLGKLSLQTNVDGYAYSFKSFAANLTGEIDSVEIQSYTYRNISLNGLFTENTWDGSINLMDENIKLDLLGLLNFGKSLPEFDFTLNIADANLYKLNFDKLDTTSSVTVLLTSNFKGNSIDNLDGEIKLLNSKFVKYGNELELYDFSIRTNNENNASVLSLRTDFLDADITGKYNFAAMGGVVKTALAKLMPTQFKAPARTDPRKNNFTFTINFKNTDRLNAFFRTGVLVADKSFLQGTVFPDSAFKVTGKSKLLSVKNNIFNDFSFDASMTGSELNAKITTSSLSLLKQSELKEFNLGLDIVPDNFTFSLGWDNKEKVLNNGSFTAHGLIVKSSEGNQNNILRIDIDSSHVYSRGKQWKIHKSDILIDSSTLKFNRLYLSNNNNGYLIDGTISKDPADTLLLDFKGIDLGILNFLVNQKSIKDPTVIPLNFSGSLSGKIHLKNVYKDLLLVSNITASDFSMLGSKYGDISIVSELDILKKVIRISGGNNLDGVKMLDIEGFYNPARKLLDLDITTSKLHIEALNPLLRVFASEITGKVSGKVKLTRSPGSIILKGALLAENASMKVDYLQTKYKMNDTVRFDKQGIKFNNMKIDDEKGNTAVLNGTIFHKNFKEYTADIIVTMANETMVLNTKPKDNTMFYGTAYASGVTTIKSGPGLLSFSGSAKTGKNTRFFIPLNSGLSVSEYSFISFIDSKADSVNENGIIINQAITAPKKTGVDINFDLDITPDAEVQMIFDSKVGDVMKGHGSGNLNISLNRKGDFRMIGDYIIEDGDYLFTLGNLFNKPFTVENGGKIIFNGDLDNAEIEIKAIYKNLKASLYPIIPEERFKERILVEPQLSLSGKLFNPTVKFDIYLPNADEETRAALRNSIATEEEMNKQIFALLIGNSFIASGSATGVPDNTAGSTGPSAISATTFEMLSNQLSNWLSQISNDFNLGVVYRPGSGNKDINPQELEFALSTQILNDKVILNTNLDVRGNTSSAESTNQITGDFDAEIKITEKIRFKVFNRYNEMNVIKGPYTQGIGILFKQDFDKFSDLFRKKEKADIKKEEEIVPKENE